jgi:ferric-dicitrate binding protein FerR (iron transport regulator)
VSGKVAVAQNHGQNDAEWNRQHHTTFNDQDRQAARNWYQQHQAHLSAGWREQDRLNPEMEGRLRAGSRLDSEMQRHVHSLPSDLSRQYGPAPHGYRYAIIGGNIVMIDDNYLVQDVFSIDVQIR